MYLSIAIGEDFAAPIVSQTTMFAKQSGAPETGTVRQKRRAWHGQSFPLQWKSNTRGARLIHRHIFHNDRLLPIEKARLSPGQAGLICGWGIFTTMRIFRGEAFAYERHWRRLEKDAGIIRLPMPYAAARVRVNLHEVIRANQVSEGAARIYLVYNNVGFWRGPEELPQVDLIICSAPLPEYREPIRLGLARARPPRGVAARRCEEHFVAPERLGRCRSAT